MDKTAGVTTPQLTQASRIKSRRIAPGVDLIGSGPGLNPIYTKTSGVMSNMGKGIANAFKRTPKVVKTPELSVGRMGLSGAARGAVGGGGVGAVVGAARTPQEGQSRISNMGRGAMTGAAIGGVLGGGISAGSGKILNSKGAYQARTQLHNNMKEQGNTKALKFFKGAGMPLPAPAPVGRPPNMAKPRTPALATGAAQQSLSPISTKIAQAKEAAAAGRAKAFAAKAGKKIKNKAYDAKDSVADYFRKDPPPPKFSGLSAGAAGAGAGALALGALGSVRANEGGRTDAFIRNAALGAGLGGAAGLIAKGPANEYLAGRHTAKLVAAKTKARELKRAARK